MAQPLRVRGREGVIGLTDKERGVSVDISVVVPICNERETLPSLYERLVGSLGPLDRSYEIIFVNDGSTDDSLIILKRFHQQDPRVRVISLSRNFGHQISLSAGLQYASGRAVILMDGDLQDPPEILAALLAKLEEGWDIVYAVRKKRKEHYVKRVCYWAFYRLLALVARPPIPMDAGDFSVLSRRAATLLNRMPERTRFVRGLRSWIGLKQTAFEYERDRRVLGSPKYTPWRLLLLALDGMAAFSYAPLRVASLVGILLAGLSVLGIVTFCYLRIFTSIFIPGYTSMIIAILALGAMQLLTIGILGEYVGRIYEEVKQRPLYIVDELLGLRELPQVDAPRGSTLE